MSITPAAPQTDRAPGELDLTARPAEAELSVELAPVEEKPYDPGPEREKKRGLIALVLVAALCSIILLAFAFAFLVVRTGTDLDVLKSVLEIVFAPVVGLVGAVTGFYFGERSR